MRKHVGQDGSAEGFGLAGVDVSFKQGLAGDDGRHGSGSCEILFLYSNFNFVVFDLNI